MPQRATFPAPRSTMHGLDHIAMQHHVQSPQHRSVLASSTTRARSVVSFLHRRPPAPRHLFAGVFCALPHDLHAVTNGFCRPPSSSLSPTVSSSSRFIALQAVSSDDHALHMYHSTDSPVASFGYATNFREQFEVKDTLGHGTFGSVFIAVRKKDGQRFAVKRMPKRFGPAGALDKYYVRRVRNEVEIGSHLGASLNIAYLYGAYEDDTRVDLVFELCSGGELWSRIKSGHAYTERDAARLVRDVLRTVAQCHASGVLMRDIKPENFLFASKAPDAPLKAIDFGISVFCEPGAIVQLRAGTPIYIAPGEHAEVAEFYMRTGTADNKEVFRAVLYAELDFESSPWDVLSPQAKEFVQRLLQRDPAARPTAEDALRHPWLAESGATGASAVPLADTIVQRLQRFGTYGKLKQAALRKVAHAALMARAKYITSTNTATTATNYISNGNESIPGAMKAVFASLDPTGSGRVSLATLRAELGGGHFRLSEEEVEQMCAQLHADAAGEVDWEAWVAAMSDWRTVRGSADWDTLVTEAFASLDVDEDASLGLADLEAALCGDDGCDVDDEAEAALREADSDGDGAVSLEEFRELLSAHDGGLELFDARLSFDMEGDGLSSSEGE